MTHPDLVRFVEAQESVHDQVTAELKAGRKRTHWMWFVFPQLTELGRSPTALHYGIADLDQARRYLADPLLGRRLREDVRRVLEHSKRTALDILGAPDDMKFRSCLTLFRAAADDPADRELFDAALGAFYAGKPDGRTLALLG